MPNTRSLKKLNQLEILWKSKNSEDECSVLNCVGFPDFNCLTLTMIKFKYWNYGPLQLSSFNSAYSFVTFPKKLLLQSYNGHEGEIGASDLGSHDCWRKL